MEITLKLPLEAINQVGQIIGKQPYVKVHHLVREIERQVTEQLAAAQLAHQLGAKQGQPPEPALQRPTSGRLAAAIPTKAS